MALGGPNIYPNVLTWLGIAREMTVGTVVNPVITHPLEQGQFEPEDTPKFLDDKAIRGSMTDLFYKTLGPESAVFSFGGPNFLDSHGYFFDNVFGDLSTVGTTPTNPATTSGVIPVGSTNFTLSAVPPAAYTANAVIQKNTVRLPKNLFTELGTGEKLVRYEGFSETDEGAAIWIVFDVLDFAGNIAFRTFKVDDTIVLASASTMVSYSNTTGIVSTY